MMMNTELKRVLIKRKKEYPLISGDNNYPVLYFYVVSTRRGSVVMLRTTQYALHENGGDDRLGANTRIYRKLIARYNLKDWLAMKHLPELVDPFTVMVGKQVLFKLTDKRWIPVIIKHLLTR